MRGNRVCADTNVLIYLAEGRAEVADQLLAKSVFVSVISEIELLGWYRLGPAEARFFQALLADCTIVPLTDPVKAIAIALRQHRKMKTPDAIVAATAIYLDIPLYSYNVRDFAGIPSLSLVDIPNT
jgi:hypothetical protein